MNKSDNRADQPLSCVQVAHMVGRLRVLNVSNEEIADLLRITEVELDRVISAGIREIQDARSTMLTLDFRAFLRSKSA